MRKRTIPTIAFLLCALFSTAQNWDQIIKAAASDRGAGDQFGYSVAISGDYAIVGAPSEDENVSGGATLSDAGSAYFFVRSGNTWTQQQKIVASDRAAGDYFGSSVGISGDYAIVGAYGEDEDAAGSATLSDAGSAYIFVRTGNTWTQQQKIVASDRGASDDFGWSVAISGDYAIVSARNEDENASGAATLSGAGSAYIFARSGNTWTQQQKIVASDRAAGDVFGYSVAISGDYAVVGAYGEDQDASGGATLSDAGSAYIFVRSGITWSQQQKIVASDRAVADFFGYSVAISGDYAIVSAYQEDENASGGATLTDAGSAYIFVRSGSSWTQQQKIVAGDRAAEDRFGWSVSISGDYAIVGGYLEDEDASGGATLSGAGSAYIFVRSGNTWTQQQKIVASDRSVNDYFGSSVAISGNFAVVGAYTEAEDASGGATLTVAGSVYFFDQNFTLTASAGANGTVTPSGATTVARGGSQTYTITPAAGYCVQDVLVNGSSVGAVTTYTFNNVQANQTISASFAATPTWYLDADNDNYYTGSGITQCTSPGAGYKSTGLLGGNDCDDADNTKWQNASLFIDADNDGYDNGSATVCYGASIPTGYKTTTSGADCNDADATKNVTYSFYADSDGDSYGTGSLVSGVCANNSSTPPSGYSNNNTDCDDNDNTKWQLLNAYIDADGDGFTIGTIQEVCSGNTLPQGYSSNSSGEDCNDNDINLSVESTWYLDTDNDGYYTQSISNCGSPGAGYNQTATTQGDCDDNDNTKWQLLNAYVDADGDGFTIGAVQEVCSGIAVPQGYSSNSSGEDTDDNNPDITTGINNLSNISETVKIYPNPTSNNFIIELQNGHNYNVLQLTDVAGKVLQQLNINTAETQKQINLTELSTGIYMLKLWGDSNNKNFRVIKQ
jgi:hypothetical protein